VNRVRLARKHRSTIRGWKLLRVRRDGSLGPLFINRSLVIPVGEWLHAEDHPTSGYAHRPGWHAAPNANAPHLSLKGRVWCPVELRNWIELPRPQTQGGTWWLAEQMRVISTS
jgi:hypothetical protein